MKPTHLADIRLKNNAGLWFPVCEAGRKFLRLGSAFNVSSVWEDVTCAKCKARAHRRYPWASWGGK